MPNGNGQVNWVSYSQLCKHIHVLFFIQHFEQRMIIFVIDRSLKTLQNAVEYLHNKSEKKRWQTNSNVSCYIFYGEHFVLGVDLIVCTSCLHFTIVILADVSCPEAHINYCVWPILWLLSFAYIAMHVVEYFSFDYRTFPSMHILFTLYYSQ